MIRRLTQADARLLEILPPVTANACRIRAIHRAYGMGYEFVRFFGNEDGSILLEEEEGFAAVWCGNPAGKEELEAFLPLLAKEVLSETELNLPGFTREEGNAYARSPFPPERLEGVKTDIATAYPLLCRVFEDAVPQGQYDKWYAGFSHRIRHGMSRVFTLPGIVTGTAYCIEEGRLMVSQLGVAQAWRGKGYGKKMLAHICGECAPIRELILHSRDSASDRFYEHLGFQKTGRWYYYASPEQEGEEGRALSSAKT